MISRLRGIVIEKQPPLALLEINGLGYEIYMPMTCFYKLPDIGKEAIVFTQCILSKDTQLLYGFNNKLERILFRELVKINSIGPKLAIAILSGISAKQLIKAIECKDSATLVKLPGIGKKTAERLIVEMKYRFNGLYYDQFTPEIDPLLMTSAKSLTHEAKQEAIAALMVLGYKHKEANYMVNKVTKPNASSETLIREALLTEL